VTGIEHQLRDLLESATGDPPRRVTAAAVRRRTVRRRLVEYGAAALAAILLAGLGVAISSQAPGPPPAPVSPSPAGLPRFYVVQGPSGGKFSVTTVVRATATGAVTATVRCPWPKASIAGDGITAASHRTFFLTCQKTAGTAAHTRVTGTRIYRFRVTGSGQVSGYSLVAGGVLNGISAGGLGTTPDGSEIAVAVTPGTAAGSGPHGPGADIMVINTRTGAHAVWHNVPKTPGAVIFGVGELSLTADGHEVVFYTRLRCVSGGNGHTCGIPGEQEVRAVSPAAAGGKLASSRVLVLGSLFTGLANGYINSARITPDGSAVTIFTAHSGPRSDTTSVLQASAATGEVVRVLYRINTGDGFSYRYFNMDPSGRFMILNTGTSGQSVNGWVCHGRLIPLKPGGGDAWYAAW
jgi:hypothetical protein